MCPGCSHFMCDRDEHQTTEGFSVILCHKCGSAALALDWAHQLIVYRLQQENEAMKGKPQGHA